MMGRIISHLANSEQISGYNSVQWHATNNIGQLVSSGPYYNTIKAGEFIEIKKVVLL